MSRVIASSRGKRWLEGGHPWLYGNDVESEDAQPGDLVAVEDAAGHHLGFGLYSRGSKIRVRLVTRDRAAPGVDFWRERIGGAVALRERLGLIAADGACRLIAGDADRVPGLVVDLYASVLVVQSGTQSSDRLRDAWLELVQAALPFRPIAIVERSESGVRRFEGLEPRSGVLAGAVPTSLEVREDDLRYAVDVLGGHKTGHYLDQRDNRRRAAAAARGGSALDVFCYDGLFGVRAALAGAREVTCIDQSEPALARAADNARRNGVEARMRFERRDAMRELRDLAREAARHELVVIDPPAFAKSKRDLPGAERGYRELNLRALQLVAPGGTLVSASCSHAMTPENYLNVIARAAADARRDAWLEHYAGASLDHPALVTLPESAYLKCAFLRVR